MAPKHRWIDEDRTLLGVIRRFYDTSANETAVIFNSIIHQRLVAEGFRNGLTGAAIAAQVNDLKNTARGRDFQVIQSMSTVDAREKFQSQRDSIETAAQELGISLRLRFASHKQNKNTSRRRGPPVADRLEWSADSEEDSDPMEEIRTAPTTSGSHKRRMTSRLRRQNSPYTGIRSRTKRIRRESTEATTITSSSGSSASTDTCSRGSWDPGANESEGEDHPGLDENDFANTARRINPLLTLRFNEAGKTVTQRPRLLFRAFEPTYRLRARAFQHTAEEIPPPPSYESHQFKVLARRHLRQEIFNSPFLSFTQSPKRAFEKHIIEGNEHRMIAIVDYNILEDEIKKRYGKGAGPWLVPDVCDDFGWDDLVKVDDSVPPNQASENRGGYRGIGEFLIWGAVLCEPVATLAYKDALDLYKVTKSISKVDYQAGVAVKPYLYSVRHIYKEVVARKLLHAFEVPGYEKGRAHFDFEEFIHGIYGELSEARIDYVGSATPQPMTNSRVNRTTRNVNAITSVSPSLMHPNLLMARVLDNSTEVEDIIQQQVDSQIWREIEAATRSLLGLASAPETELRQTLSGSQCTDIGGEILQHAYLNQADIVNDVSFKETAKTAKVTTAKSTSDEEVVAQRRATRASTTLEFDAFMTELPINAMVPTPTPPPHKYTSSIKAEVGTEPFTAVPVTPSSIFYSTAADKGKQEDEGLSGVRNGTGTVDINLGLTASSAVSQSFNDIGTPLKQTSKCPKQPKVPHLEPLRPAALPLQPLSKPTTSSTITERGQVGYTRAANVSCKAKAPETLSDLQMQSRQCKEPFAPTTIDHEPSKNGSKSKKPGVRKQVGKVAKPSRATANNTKTQTIEQNGDNDFEIVSETIRTHESEHVRTTTKTETRTVLTVRSRSLSENFALSQRK